MTIPQNGRYVVRAELAAFAAATQQALLNATSHDHQIDFTLLLASRAAQQEQQQERAAQASQYSGRGTQSLSLTGAASDLIAAASGSRRRIRSRSSPPSPGITLISPVRVRWP